MTPGRKRMSLGLSVLVLFAALPAHAQVSVLGKGFLLDSAGSLTSAPAEVISGRNSIKGSYTGTNSYTSFLYTDPTFIQFTANQTYTITLSYRIITAGTLGFEFGFYSGQAGSGGPFVPAGTINGASGSSGTATHTFTLFNHSDYAAGFKVVGTGTIAIDDIRITSAGQLVASENAEGPTIAPGPLNFQITDATATIPAAGAVVRSAAVRDLNGDGYPETILTLTAPRPSTTPLPPIVIEANARMRLATADFFPTGAPTVKHSPVTLFADVNNDGLQDILFADAGSDAAPFPGSGIGIALNMGGGKYRDVSSLVPADLQTTRSYALAVGDIDGDGRVEIILPDENGGSRTALLRWNGNGFDAQRNWIASSLWTYPTNLYQQTWMVINDLDKDGRQDLLVSGAAYGTPPPNLRILFGAAGGYSAAGLVQLPDGLFGHSSTSPLGVTQGADVGPVVVADFNNDGLPDIFATEEQVLNYPPGVFTDPNEPGYEDIHANGGVVYADVGFQVLVNQGSRTFADVTSGSTVQNLGRRYYSSLIPIDMNNDGFLDVVGLYQTKFYAGVRAQWGTTLFLNDGTGAFHVVDGAQLLAAVTTTPSNGQRWNLGSFVPTVANPHRMEGIVFEPVGGCGGAGFCAVQGLNLYKVVANAGIGTGPNFVDSASLGVPGFNEFYYLRHYPDAAAAVQAGQYASGLAHYLAVGASAGYQPHAPNGIVPLPTISAIADNTATRRNTPLTVNVAVGDAVGGAPGVTVTAVSSNPALVPSGSIIVSGTGSARTMTLVPAPNQIGTATITVFASARGFTSSTTFTLVVYVPSPGDFDGDRKTDVAIFRPSTGQWFVRQSRTLTPAVLVWGGGNDKPVPGDYDGDGLADIAVFRPSTGEWFVRQTSTFTLVTLVWGGGSDVPVAADYDGDGITDVAIFRPSSGQWFVRQSSTFTLVTLVWGGGTDIPVPGDYDGDAKTDVAIFRPSTGQWFVRQSSTLTLVTLVWGGGSDIPVPGDYDGDGKIDIAVFRPSTSEWFVRQTSTLTLVTLVWGGGADIPVPGDYDGDGKTDIVIFRPSTGEWFVRQSSTLTLLTLIWGGGSDIPVLKRL